MTDPGFPSNSGYLGKLDAASATDRFNELNFVFQQLLSKVRTALLVKIISCSNDGGVIPVGTVSVQPLVNQVDGYGNAVPHGTVFNLPYWRMQGGTSAVIIDPVAGDVGLAVFCDRDISSVVANRAQTDCNGIPGPCPSNPGSARTFSMSDGCYIGGYINQTPVQYIQFLPDNAGIMIYSPGQVISYAGTVATVYGQDVIVYGSRSLSTDVGGYGERLTKTGPSTFNSETWHEGATVTDIPDHGYSPPQIPPETPEPPWD